MLTAEKRTKEARSLLAIGDSFTKVIIEGATCR